MTDQFAVPLEDGFTNDQAPYETEGPTLEWVCWRCRHFSVTPKTGICLKMGELTNRVWCMNLGEETPSWCPVLENTKFEEATQ